MSDEEFVLEELDDLADALTHAHHQASASALERSLHPRTVLTVAEVAEMCGAHEQTVYTWIREGHLAPVMRLGRKVLVPRHTLMRYVTPQETQ